MDRKQATGLLVDALEEGTKVIACIENDDHFLFIAHTTDPLEGTLDPFYRVDKKTAAIRDWSIQNYPNPREIIDRLNADIDETSGGVS